MIGGKLYRAFDQALAQTKDAEYRKYLQGLHDGFTVLNRQLPAAVPFRFGARAEITLFDYYPW